MNWLRNRRKISGQDLLGMLKRIDGAYGIVELNEKEPMILEIDQKVRLSKVRSTKDRNEFYRVDAYTKTCSSPVFNFLFLKCISLRPNLPPEPPPSRWKWSTGLYAPTKVQPMLGLPSYYGKKKALVCSRCRCDRYK